jgi:hypothetical protein
LFIIILFEEFAGDPEEGMHGSVSKQEHSVADL